MKFVCYMYSKYLHEAATLHCSSWTIGLISVCVLQPAICFSASSCNSVTFRHHNRLIPSVCTIDCLSDADPASPVPAGWGVEVARLFTWVNRWKVRESVPHWDVESHRTNWKCKIAWSPDGWQRYQREYMKSSITVKFIKLICRGFEEEFYNIIYI